jgi:hypothetical protein
MDKIREILEQLPNNLEVWKDLAARFKIDMFCGLFMDRTNEGLGFSPDTLLELGKRGIELGLDIYGPTFDDDLEVQIAKARSRPAKLSH